MTQKIEIGVDAKLDARAVEQGAKKIDKVLQDVGKRKIDPVPDSAVKKVDALFQAYLKLDREMARRLKVTGQQGRSPEDVNWDPVYQNAKSRSVKMQQLQTFLKNGGADFQPPDSGGGKRGGWKQTAGGIAGGAVQAGMRATGPAGGVAANALGTGMSSGFGAGLAGLMGGMVALGVGKLVGAVMEKIDQAENNNIALDRLKRTLGDVNVSFDGLKSAVKGTGDGLKITYEESEKLATQFAKNGNVKGSEYSTLPGEIGAGVGLSRGFGLDPSQGVGVLGQMRGVGATRDLQDSKRMAILIGETISKSDAFAKADEVMEALAQYTTNQTRQSVGGANTSAYAGLFSSLVSSGLGGLDPTGAAALLGKVNSNLSAGGGKGEASQFFTSMVGNDMGLNPLQMQVMREGGMFANKDKMFGVGSAYTRYMGQTGPTGDQTFYSATRERLDKQRFSSDDETDKLMRANAFANHATGGNMNQAMALLSMDPKQMGELEKRIGGSFGTMSMSGIANAAKAQDGTDEERAALAESFRNRSDVSQSDKDRLNAAMSSGDLERQKDVLAKLSAQYEQEKTMGSDIRDSRAILDNIKTNVADKMVPYLLDMKKAMIYLAGEKGGKTPAQVMEDISKGESKDRLNSLKSGHDAKLSDIDSRRAQVAKELRQLSTDEKAGKVTPEQYTTKMKELQQRSQALEDERKSEDSNYAGQVEAEKIRAEGEAAKIRKSISTGISRPAGMGALGADKSFLDKVSANEREIGAPAGLLRAQLEQESMFHPGSVSPAGAMGLAQVMPGTLKAIEKRVGRKLDPFNPEDALLIQKEVMKENKQKFGNWDDATSAYNGGWDKSTWGNSETSKYTPAIRNRMERYQREGTPLPDSGAGHGRGVTPASAYEQLRITADPITVRFEGTNGQQVRPDQTIQTKIGAPDPNTFHR